MSWLGWGSSTNPQYEELVEKACSPLNLPYPQSENIADSLEVTDMIRSKAVQPKPAMQSLKRRIASPNGRVQMYALGLTDTCIKNGGDHFLAEIASKEFVDEMSRLIKLPTPNADVKQMALRLFQQWALAFQSKRDLAFLVDVYNELKSSGTQFPAPPAQTSSHLFSTITAPAWVDSDVCMRCRTAFTFTNRKHHCRNCGLVFDQACSSKTMELPHFGITTPVRVCDSCHAKGPKAKPPPSGPPPAVPGRTPRSRADYDADLQRAIELSLADGKANGTDMRGSEPPIARAGRTAEDDDEELRLAIEASLREMETARPSAPNGLDEPEYKPLPTFDLHPRETETILTFSNTLDQMAAYGERDLRRFPHAHVLYEQAYAIGGKLHRNVEEKATKQQMLAEMQDKLSQAVSLYGQVLDGQQAYNARKLQEQQQRQYAQHQQYAYQHPQYQSQSPYGYDPRYAPAPAPQANGYGYAPQPQPQHGYGPPAQQPAPAVASSSLYPSMPQPQQAAPQIYPAQGYQPPQTQTYAPSQPYPVQGYASPPRSDHALQRHASLQAHAPPGPAIAAGQPGVQRTASMNYHSSAPSEPHPHATHAQHAQFPPQPQSSQPFSYAAQHPSAPALSTPSASASASSYSEPTPLGASPVATAPSAPPVDMASHPGASPARSVTGLPQPQRTGSFSYTSPTKGSAPLSPRAAEAHGLPPQHQQYASAPAPALAPAQHHQQLPQQQLYYESSFPTAPGAVFPDVPASDLDRDRARAEQAHGDAGDDAQGGKTQARAQVQEAMLIEL